MPDDSSLRAWLALSLTKGLGGEGARSLLKAFGSPEAIYAASPASLKPFVTAPVAATIANGIDDNILVPTLFWLEDSNNHIVTLADSAFPQALLNIPDPPLLLYVKGRLDLLNHSAFAIIGSRNATPQGISNAEAFSRALSATNLCIISGLAHGIDAAAHRGALPQCGSSIAVVGTGLDRVYPAANHDLAHSLSTDGAVISEFPLGTPPIASNFPRRNRIISGMSMGCLIVEAGLQSGSLITARLALEQGKDVFAIPGSIHSPQSKGCHHLIQQGAKLVESAQDILEDICLQIEAHSDSIPPTEIHSELESDSILMNHLGFDPVSIDTLLARSGLTMPELSAMLLSLEMAGRVSALSGGHYQRNP